MLKRNRVPPPRKQSRLHPWLAAFFAFGASMCALTIALLLFPGTPLDALWRLNPDAHAAFEKIGRWSIPIMFIVGAACCSAAMGLWRGARWGTRLALVILSANMLGDLINTVFRHDYRALIGLPVASVMIFYLVRK
jgi:predicted lysophospholipase L1 biosynthesis ABC-type transport system permease subunit